MPSVIAERREGLAWWSTLSAVTVILLGPLLITDVPPVLDYPNHLARFVLLAAGKDDAVLGQIFTPEWTIIPNLAGDAIGLLLLQVLPVHTAGRVLLGIILLLNLAGVLALHRAYFARRSFWPLGSCLVAYNCSFLLGFLNWQISSGLAMLCAAGWLVWRDRRPVATIAAAMGAAILLFFCHLIGLVFFLLLIASAELRAMRNFRGAIIRCIGLLAVLAGPIGLATLAAVHEAPLGMHWPRLDVKLVNAASPFINYLFPFDLITAAVVYGGIMVGIAAGRLTLAPRAVAVAVIIPVAYFVLPFDLMSGSFLDMRFAVMFGFLLFAAVEPAPQRRNVPVRTFQIAATCCVVLFAVRMAIVAGVWTEHRRDIGELRSVTASIPVGAKVFFTNVPQEEAPAYWDAGPRSRRLSNGLRADYHLPALLLIERRAFWPVLFANPAQQPIRLQAAYATLAREGHDIPAHDRLVADQDIALPALCHFDFVLMLEAGADHDLAAFMSRSLVLEARSDFAAVFRVLKDAPACTQFVERSDTAP